MQKCVDRDRWRVIDDKKPFLAECFIGDDGQLIDPESLKDLQITSFSWYDPNLCESKENVC